MWGGFLGDEQAMVAYFGAAYVGRPGPNGRRRPMFPPAWRGVAIRTRTGSIRANNASGA